MVIPFATSAKYRRSWLGMFRLERLAKDGSDLQRPSVFAYAVARTIMQGGYHGVFVE